ncbi:serine/threonine-protein kinase [Archangium primigenium]|uniref:serine/threonine-protein kinase n=1 Tax=[Archangium] primigenium TaxID=2792470 RepID=UPI00195BB9EC|nr:serine/threonine-protein kinase [Archangium primigenium]MBM7117719.1 serine/threonine protein kinase [Archangium primigenium]
MLSKGTQVGEYRLLRFVAEGLTGTVYEGRRASDGASVAIKVLHPTWCIDPEVMARFLNEARMLQGLAHPHLVKGLSSGELPEGPPYMVLEWHPEDLARALARVGGRLSCLESVQVVGQLAEVLSLLHAKGIIHRDLKPENVLVARRVPGDWSVRLADLGLAKRLPSAGPEGLPISTAGGTMLGTADYRPPEQWFDAKTVGPSADVYSLGVLWFQLLTGQLPFQSSGQQGLMILHVRGEPPLALLEGRASDAVRTMMARMLAKDAEDRPALAEVLGLLTPGT